MYHQSIIIYYLCSIKNNHIANTIIPITGLHINANIINNIPPNPNKNPIAKAGLINKAIIATKHKNPNII